VSHRERNDLQRSADPQLRQLWLSWRKLFPGLSLLWRKKAILQPLPKRSQWAHWSMKIRWQHMRQLLCDSEQQRLLINTDRKTQKSCNKVQILHFCPGKIWQLALYNNLFDEANAMLINLGWLLETLKIWWMMHWKLVMCKTVPAATSWHVLEEKWWNDSKL